MYYICTDVDITQITEPLYITGSSKNPDGEFVVNSSIQFHLVSGRKEINEIDIDPYLNIL